jgi:DNA (cytosine-5)-methyltransferase 1
LTQSTREQWRMAGNATPPLLAEVVGHAVAYELGLSILKEKKPTLAIERVREIPPPKVPVAIDERFIGQIGPKAAHPGEGYGPAPREKIA